jgi:hypothetical protein
LVERDVRRGAGGRIRAAIAAEALPDNERDQGDYRDCTDGPGQFWREAAELGSGSAGARGRTTAMAEVRAWREGRRAIRARTSGKRRSAIRAEFSACWRVARGAWAGLIDHSRKVLGKRLTAIGGGRRTTDEGRRTREDG